MDASQTEEKYYLRVGVAGDLSLFSDRAIYRFFEMLPGILAWATLIGIVLISWRLAFWASLFIIAFDVYWLVKTVFLLEFMTLSTLARIYSLFNINTMPFPF